MTWRVRLALLASLLVVAPGCRRGDKPSGAPKAKAPVVEQPSGSATPTPAEPSVEEMVDARGPRAELPFPAVYRGTLPADDARWGSAVSYRRTPIEYGEPDWDHVRLHAVVHLSLAGRDLARARASAGDWAGCASRYRDAEAAVRAPTLQNPAVTPVREVLAEALGRDAAVCAALADRKAPIVPATGGLAMYRARYLGLHVRSGEGADVRRAASTLQDQIGHAAAPGGSLELTAPAGVRDPALQALWLAEAWVDTVDPVSLTEPWGPWTLGERTRQVKALRQAASSIAAGETRRLHVLPAASLRAEPTDYSVDEFASVPLTDAYIDVGGFAAPHAVPRLALYGEDDPAWTSWITGRTNLFLDMRAGEIVAAVRTAVVGDLAERPEGSRYFNIIGLENATIRQLARGGHYAEALEVLRLQSPMGGLDWFMPDRAAVVLGLDGRLKVLGGFAGGERRLEMAMAESKAFLAFVDMCVGLDAQAMEAAHKAREMQGGGG